MTRLALFSALLIAGLAATGAAMFVARGGAPAPARQAAPARPAVPKAEPAAGRREEDRGGDRAGGRSPRSGRAGVEVEVLERFLDHEGPGYARRLPHRRRRPGPHRLDPRSDGTRFMACPDDRTLGWAYLRSRRGGQGDGRDPDPLVLLSRNHEVEGSVVDRAGRAIPGVRIHAASVEQEERSDDDYLFGRRGDSRIGSAVTDAAGRYGSVCPTVSPAFAACTPGMPGRRSAAPTADDPAGEAGGCRRDRRDGGQLHHGPARRGGEGACPVDRGVRAMLVGDGIGRSPMRRAIPDRRPAARRLQPLPGRVAAGAAVPRTGDRGRSRQGRRGGDGRPEAGRGTPHPWHGHPRQDRQADGRGLRPLLPRGPPRARRERRSPMTREASSTSSPRAGLRLSPGEPPWRPGAGYPDADRRRRPRSRARRAGGPRPG